MTGPPTVVLVHDAWHDARAWDPVGLCLDARRRRWRALTLPSIRPATQPTGGWSQGPPGFAADVGAVIDLVEAIGDEVVLCGHGYGGLVVSEAGNHPAVVGLALVAAFCPEPGESLVDLARRALPANGFGWPALRVRQGWVELAPRWAPRLLFGDLPAVRRPEAVAGLRASSVPALSARVSSPAWARVPTVYGLCRRDRLLGLVRGRTMAERVVRAQVNRLRFDEHLVVLDTGHCPQLTAPTQVASLLARWA